MAHSTVEPRAEETADTAEPDTSATPSISVSGYPYLQLRLMDTLYDKQ
jgi:hypothetical protein